MNNEIAAIYSDDMVPVPERSNPFAQQGVMMTGMTANAAIEAARVVGEVKAMISSAKEFPRDPLRSYDNIMKSCQRRGLAERATYEYARGGTNITGPSIRLAEVIANEWGNIIYGFKELESSPGRTLAQAFAWNLETNVRVSRDVTIPHERHTKKGSIRLTDPRDIYELVANQMQRRVRACILEVVPGDVVEDAVAECLRTLKASADTSAENVASMLKAFQEFGVSRAMIEKFIQRKIEAITAGNVVRLKSIYGSLRDGMATPADFFEMEEPSPAPKKLVDAIPKKKKTPAIEQRREDAPPTNINLFDEFMKKIQNVSDPLAIDEIRSEIDYLQGQMTEDDLQTLDAAVREKEALFSTERKQK